MAATMLFSSSRRRRSDLAIPALTDLSTMTRSRSLRGRIEPPKPIRTPIRTTAATGRSSVAWPNSTIRCSSWPP